MSALIVRGIAFQPLKQHLFSQKADSKTAFSWLSEMLAAQTKQIIAPLTAAERAQLERHFLCSTMIDLPFTTGDISWSEVAAMLAEHGSNQADTFINAYECASWGFSLRHYLQQSLTPSPRFLLVSIIDANIYDLEFWRYNEHWHQSGFGITTVLLEVTKEVTDELVTQGAATHNSMAEFATVVRRSVTGRENCTLAMPFFPQDIQQMFNKLLAKQHRLPDLHQDWGHCFGADPWLSILSHCLDHKVTQPQQYLACSLALNGYFAMAEVTVTPQTQFIRQEVKGYE